RGAGRSGNGAAERPGGRRGGGLGGRGQAGRSRQGAAGTVRAVLQVALGILAAIGGFVDIGELVFNGQAGSRFGYSLVWAILVGLGGILVYSEMCGRVAAVSRRAVFDLIRERAGFQLGLVTLLAAALVCLMTLTAELGGVVLVLQLFTGLPFPLLLPAASLVLLVVFFILPLDWLERLFGYGGLCLAVFAAAALIQHPDWHRLSQGVLPSIDPQNPALHLSLALRLLAPTPHPYDA